MAHSGRFGAPIREDQEEDDPFFNVPSLDDIIPWTPKPKPPRQLLVSDPVRTDTGEINVVFLENVLKSYYSRDGPVPELVVDDFTEAPMDALDISLRNILTEVNVEATVDGRNETFHLVIKTLTNEQPMRDFSAVYSFDLREVSFYTKILDDLEVFQQQENAAPGGFLFLPSSKCLFTRYEVPRVEIHLGEGVNTHPEETVIVLENKKYQGFSVTMIHQSLTVEQVLTVFEGISRLHGLSLAMKERSGMPLTRSYPYLLCLKDTSLFLVQLFDQKIENLLTLLTRHGAQKLGKKLLNFRPYLEEITGHLLEPEEPMSALTHMNLWAHNILFKGNDECVFVDWQMIACSRPAIDLAFLLATSVKSSVRKANTDQFLDYYFDHLKMYAMRVGLDIEDRLEYTRQDLQEEFFYCQLLALFFFIGKSSELITSEETELQFVEYVKDLDEQNLLNIEDDEEDSDEEGYPGPDDQDQSKPGPPDLDGPDECLVNQGHLSSKERDNVRVFPSLKVSDKSNVIC